MQVSGSRPPRLRTASVLDRVLALAVLASFAWLVWLAGSGRLDAEIDAFARWLRDAFG